MLRMRRPLSHALWAGVLLAGPMTPSASAQLVTEPLRDDQYHVVEIADGLLRIDRQTGEVTQCSSGDGGWICRLAADDRQAYEAEISRLDGEVERLEDALASASAALAQAQADMQALQEDTADQGRIGETPLREEPLGLLPGDQESPSREELRERLNLPTDEELDAVMDTAEEAMRRFFGMVQTLRQDMEAERGN